MPVVPIQFSGRVKDELDAATQETVAVELLTVLRKLDRNRELLSVYVPRLFSGYAPNYAEKAVLAVEATYTDGYETYIVKLGLAGEVGPDYSGWESCTMGSMVASRIFAPVRQVPCEAGPRKPKRLAVIYRDAFSLFGPDESGQPKLLEEAIHWAVLDERPDPLSAERALAHIFTDLGQWFFPRARIVPPQAWHFYATRLRFKESDRVLDLWHETPQRAALRRHAVWVLAGRDVPDADPFEKPARYLDPVEYVTWALSHENGDLLPSTLIGRSHGDLHARNVLVGVRRGEVEYPAVFDYGKMSPNNVLAWDFAKLETELKVRILPRLARIEHIGDWLRLKSGLRKMPATLPTFGIPTETSKRADRLAMFLAFEETLDELTRGFVSLDDAERLCPLSRKPTGIQELDRLLAILLRIRREAAVWLGFRPHKRQDLWKDELYFALGVCGLLNVRWSYETPSQESALVSAGAALARMPSMPSTIQRAIEQEGKANGSYVSYRIPLARAYDLWKNKEYKEGCALVEKVAIVLKRDPDGRVTQIKPHAKMSHAIPLLGQAALLETEAGHLQAVEDFLDTFRQQACDFHDFETLGRIGRLFKEAGDLKLAQSRPPAARAPRAAKGQVEPPIATRQPALQMYDKAFVIYEQAFLLTDDWYTGVNAATLAFLTGRTAKANEYARKVVKICADKLDHEQGERYWLFATEGEAALILGEAEDACRFYRDALAELTPGKRGMANSSYKQACRVWHFSKDEHKRQADSVLMVFEDSEFSRDLTPNFIGRDFPNGKKFRKGKK